MKCYLFQNKEHHFSKSFMKLLDEKDVHFENVELPADHERVRSIFGDKPGGVIFIPAVWSDLFCVKIIQEIQQLSRAFVTVLVGKKPTMANMTVAFNEGLTGFVKIPATELNYNQVFVRAKSRFDQLKQIQILKKKVTELEGKGSSDIKIAETSTSDLLLGKAMLDMIKQRGPLFDSSIKALLVTSSSTQQKQLADLLKHSGMVVSETRNIKDGIEQASKKDFSFIITDGVLPDGDATDLTKKLRKLNKEIPHVFVWSASPEKTDEFLDPAHHIDGVILKIGLERGMEAILPFIISKLYQGLNRIHRTQTGTFKPPWAQ